MKALASCEVPRRRLQSALLAMLAMLAALTALRDAGADAGALRVDTALVLAVDVSDSVDETRYRLQMEGISRALEDDAVIDAITGGAHGGIALSLVTWADGADMIMPWQLIRSREDALSVAAIVRTLPQSAGTYTCLARMLTHVHQQVLASLPVRADRLVLDVSGDGIDNCIAPTATDAARDGLLARGVTINGLPIIVAGENDVVGSGTFRQPGFPFEDLGVDRDTTTLDAWYTAHVIGGPGAFIKAADGYEDFGRAFRKKFVTEISAR